MGFPILVEPAFHILFVQKRTFFSYIKIFNNLTFQNFALLETEMTFYNNASQIDINVIMVDLHIREIQ
jgi:hypothetical protein